MADDRVADDAAAAGQHGEQCGGQCGLGQCLVDEAAEGEGDERGPLRRLEDDRVASGECGGELLGVAGDGRVPRGDRADDADGLVDAHRDVRAAGRGDRVLGGLQCGGGVAEGARSAQYEGTGLGTALAGVGGLQGGEPVGVALDEVGDAVQQPGPQMGGQLTPSGVVGRVDGGGHGVLDVVEGCGVHGGDDLAGGGVDGLDGGTAALPPLPCDQHFVGKHQLASCSRYGYLRAKNLSA